MIPRNTMDVSTVESNFDGEKIDMTIDESSLSHIMSVLTDLYSDTQMAVIREYSTNARDTHVESGKADVPIEVFTPNRMSPMFKVRDYGLGLSLDDIRNVYSKYGASTKRGSDMVNGMLGLGAKSALTYTSSFTVVAVKDGVKNIVSVGRSEDGSGYMEIVDSGPTSDGNGVEIQVPVPTQDSLLFASKVHDFFDFWEAGTVKIDGKVNEGLNFAELAKIDDKTYLSTSGSIRGSIKGNTIVMGGVAYPAPFDSPFRWNTKFIYFADMGDAVFSPSRESLLTNKKNRDLFDSIISNIGDKVVESAKAQVESSQNKAEAYITAGRLISESVSSVKGFNHGLSPDHFEYRGESLFKFKKEFLDELSTLR